LFPNWFAVAAQDNFENLLHEFAGKPGLKFAQLGAYTGDASVWLVDNILTDDTCVLYDVDTWGGSEEEAHEVLDFSEVYKYYLSRTSNTPQVKSFKMTSLKFLREQPLSFFDFVYVDADHRAASVLIDAELSWVCLKVGGVLAFDDYLWRERMDRDDLHPQPGIHTFLERHDGEWELIVKNWQLWVRKIK
jgi:predicted O-methyltransferase YrrM